MLDLAPDPIDRTRPRAHPRRARVIGRLLSGLGALLALSAGAFFGISALPGDAATARAGALGPEAVALLRQSIGLDRPVVVRYGEWLSDLLGGSLGQSYASGTSVAGLLRTPVLNSALLCVIALVGVVIVTVVLGAAAALREGGFADSMIRGTGLALQCCPEFVVAALLAAVLAGVLGVLPALSLVPVGETPLDRPLVLVLPAVALVLVASGYAVRLVRSVLLSVVRRPYVQAAVLAGLPARVVVRRHILPAAVGPLTQVGASVLPYLLGGTVVVEQVFAYPGLGSLLIGAAAARDVPVVMGITMLLAVVVLIGYRTADSIGAWQARRSGALEVGR